jgi:hypothetical protein
LTFSKPMLAIVEVMISFLSSLVRPRGMRRLACIDNVSQTLRVGTNDVSCVVHTFKFYLCFFTVSGRNIPPTQISGVTTKMPKWQASFSLKDLQKSARSRRNNCRLQTGMT